MLQVAFHFDAEGFPSYSRPLEELVFRALKVIPADRRHVVVATGDLITSKLPAVPERRREMLQVLALGGPASWSTLSPEALAQRVTETRIYLVVCQGLTLRDVFAVDRYLMEGSAHYMGGVEVVPTLGEHWVFYEQLIGAGDYRLVRDELRVLVDAFTLEGEKSEGTDPGWRLGPWQESGLFNEVSLENTGLRGTVFDEYDSLEQRGRVAQLGQLLDAHFSFAANHVLLSIEQRDPQLVEPLLAAYQRLEAALTTEDLAHAALSCRRFMQRLADCLFPPRSEPHRGRAVGNEQYVNRLRAYIADSLNGSAQEAVESTLDDTERRVTRLNKLANSGLHGDAVRDEVRLLLMSLSVLAYELLSLQPPITEPNFAPYQDGFLKSIRQWIDAEGEDE
jgi:hypothetical protein